MSHPAASGKDDDSQEEVIVTGSRIVSTSLDSPSPVHSLTSEDIASTGILNTQDLLLKNPTFGTPTLSRTNSAFLTSGAGVATVDLRNLGVDRTLTLVDGRRFVSGNPGSQAVDYNTIPAQFIERIDILTGGASAVYGSDAVAGVVNIIYKKNFEGVASKVSTAPAPKTTTKRRSSASRSAPTPKTAAATSWRTGLHQQGSVMSRDRERSAIDQGLGWGRITGDATELFESGGLSTQALRPGPFHHVER